MIIILLYTIVSSSQNILLKLDGFCNFISKMYKVVNKNEELRLQGYQGYCSSFGTCYFVSRDSVWTKVVNIFKDSVKIAKQQNCRRLLELVHLTAVQKSWWDMILSKLAYKGREKDP